MDHCEDCINYLPQCQDCPQQTAQTDDLMKCVGKKNMLMCFFSSFSSVDIIVFKQNLHCL